MFAHPIDAVHAFYTIIAYWDITATVAINEVGTEARVIGFKGQKLSDHINVLPRHTADFKKLVETHYVFTNEGSGLTVDYYFSRFDEVLARIDPEYVKQHGIFFTNDNLSKFALWYVKEQFGAALENNFIVFDPAGGSGNLVSSWRGKLKHKIISELQPDLLRIIERRMKADPYHVETGFTIVPKTSDNNGLNFLDKSAASYLHALENELALKHIALDKPLAYLLNPPYKNTDENVKAREDSGAEYVLHPDILLLTGEDAGKERYLAFLGQILLMAHVQYANGGHKPMVMIFTPTSWLIPRPTYINFRKKWDQHFSFHSGFIVTSNEWFKLNGTWPLAFTIWQYEPDENREENNVVLSDLTQLNKQALNIDWKGDTVKLKLDLDVILHSADKINVSAKRQSIKDWTGQSMYDFKRDATKTETESKQIFGGLPMTDERRGNKKTYGIANSTFIGFMDDCTPVRVKGKDDRFKKDHSQQFWFRLDGVFKDINKSKCFNGPTDNRAYCAYDLATSKACCNWFCITKAMNGLYPTWANQYDIWAPLIPTDKAPAFYALCFAFVLAENRCVVTKFEKDNPVAGAPEVFADNPLSPNNPNSFWRTVLEPEVKSSGSALANELANAITELYKYWNHNYTKGQFLYHVGLHGEAYFKYFSYPDFVTPNSGLIQIKKYADLNNEHELQVRIDAVTAITKTVKAEIYRLLVRDFGYFG